MEADFEREQPEFCLRHPNVETGLRCGACDGLICPRCLVQTPVGARCPSCARLRRAPMYDISPRHYASAYGAALLTGAGLGLAWWFALPDTIGLFLSALGGAGLGWVMFNAVDRAAAGKRGLPIQAAAVLGIGLAYLLRNALEFDALLISDDLSGIAMAGVGILVAVTQIR